jgi:hypothetical protein
MATCVEPLHLKPTRSSDCDISISPYDQPKSMSALYSEPNQSLELNFFYISDEPAKVVRLGSESIVRLGKNSNRVHSISIPLKGIDDYSHLTFRLYEQLRRLESQASKSSFARVIPFMNYQAVSSIFEKNMAVLKKYLQSIR